MIPSLAEKEISLLGKRYLPELEISLKSTIPVSNSKFFGSMRYHLGWESFDGTLVSLDTGKRLRPLLCLASCEISGGNWRSAIPAATALELIHNFSLLHDDVQDGDRTRRGRATVWTIFGIGQAIAAGNGMRVVADQTMFGINNSNIARTSAIAASEELTLRYLEMIEGQYLDMSFESANTISTDQYLDMISRKTGALIEASMHIGSIIATGNKDFAQTFGKCGRSLGLAFQIRDDLLGIWGDPSLTGKAVGADIRRKKKSLPIVFLFQHASKDDQSWLSNAYKKDTVSESEVLDILELMEKLQVREYVQKEAEENAEIAMNSISRLGISQDSLKSIEAIAKFFTTRNK